MSPDPRMTRAFTSKQMGDACEMLVAAELTLVGIPAVKAPDNWPHYDVIAQSPDRDEPWRVSVKSRTFKKGQAFVSYVDEDKLACDRYSAQRSTDVAPPLSHSAGSRRP